MTAFLEVGALISIGVMLFLIYFKVLEIHNFLTRTENREKDKVNIYGKDD
jgi:hypothetical protein